MSDSAHTIYWKNSIKITPVYSLSGYSRAAENTGFYCKELEMAFDAGIQTNEVPAFICLTHLHNDHMCALNKMLIDNPKNPIIFIPNNNKFEELLTTTLKYIYISSKFIHPESVKGKDPKTRYPYKIVKLDVGQSYKFKDTKSGSFYIQGLPSDHGVASISFGIYEMRRRCKPEYQSLEKSEYAKLKANGVEFTEMYKFPIICYMSDTNHLPLNGPKSEMIFQYPTIVIECSFLEKEDLHHAKKKNHIHWDNLYPIISLYPETKFVLTHFSKKYTWPEIKSFFDKINRNNNINNVILWLHTGIVDYSKINEKVTVNNIKVVDI
ncbi:beta-lactamase superfamily domain [Tupanvirus soda lake]|uniref:Beta-lactamase superfamily domain n=2 Tax=Tupanvirus TaxID=2094720 RepID=A0A6N1NX79_9VIRU|nr:beta-lactamase superfamily domain [Tupanvirus soda lake]QKU34822.1 beta-lactamase superfamily domain [Tupanvirus soda lake]